MPHWKQCTSIDNNYYTFVPGDIGIIIVYGIIMIIYINQHLFLPGRRFMLSLQLC